MELSSYFYKGVFQIVYYIHPNKKHANEVTVRVFEKAWENIKEKSAKTPISFWFVKLALIVSYYHLQAEAEVLKNTNQFQMHFTTTASEIEITDLEDKFLQLSIKQRIVLTLYVKLQFTPTQIENAFSDMTSKEVKENLSGMLFYLKPYSKHEVVTKLSLDKFEQFLNEGSIKELTPYNYDTGTIENFNKFIDELNGLFTEVSVTAKILEMLRSALHYNSEKQLHETKDIDDHKKNDIELKFEEQSKKIIEDNNKTIELSLEPIKKKITFRQKISVLLLICLALFLLIHFI